MCLRILLRKRQEIIVLRNFLFYACWFSGGNSQLIVVRDYLHMEIIGQTIDDAAGEAFDKCAKVIGLPYPGGPLIDKLAKEGNPKAIQFAKPQIPNLDYSFSGLKTSFLYYIRDRIAENPNYIDENKADICASLQHTIIQILMGKLKKACLETGIKNCGCCRRRFCQLRVAACTNKGGRKIQMESFYPCL